MAWGKSRKQKAEEEALVAAVGSAVMSDPMWSSYTGLDSTYSENELWRLYRAVPEFARGAEYVGSCCSRVRIYVAEVDDRGEVGPEVSKTNKVGVLAKTVLGGPTRQPDLQRLVGVNSIVTGQYWILGLSVADEEKDKWFVVNFNELKQISDFIENPGGRHREQFIYNTGKTSYTLQEGRDLRHRVWTEDPEYTGLAISPGKTLLVTLTELELLTRTVLAAARSRLVNGGVWVWPVGTDAPTRDGIPSDGQRLMQKMQEAASKPIGQPGSADQITPIIAEFPKDVFDRIQKPIMFGGELSKETIEQRKELRNRVASGLSVAPEVILGMGDATHWNGPNIAQQTIDDVIVPIMTRLCNALTEIYLQPGLEKIGENPKKYRFWFDTAALVTRPNRFKETMEMYLQGIVGWQEVLRAADLPDAAHMSEEEQNKVLAIKLLLSDANSLLIPAIRELAGLKIDIAPDGVPMSGPNAIAGRAPSPPPPERTLNVPVSAEAPQRSVLPNAPNNAVPGTQNRAPVQQAALDASFAMVVAADAACRQALEKVGKALLRQPGGGAYRTFAHEEIFHHIRVGGEGHARALLAHGFGHLEAQLGHMGRENDAQAVRTILTEYCVALVTADPPIPYEVRSMRAALEREGLL